MYAPPAYVALGYQILDTDPRCLFAGRLAGQTCAMCEMQKHIQAAMTSGRVVKPVTIVNKLKVYQSIMYDSVRSTK